jgi:glutamine synthetase
MGYLHSFMSAAIVASAGSGLRAAYGVWAGGGGRAFAPSGAGNCGSDDDCGSAIGGIANGEPDTGASGSALAMGGIA